MDELKEIEAFENFFKRQGTYGRFIKRIADEERAKLEARCPRVGDNIHEELRKED